MPLFTREHAGNAAPRFLVGIASTGKYYIALVDTDGSLLVNVGDRSMRDNGYIDVATAIPGSEDFAHNQVTVQNSAATLIVAARSGRAWVDITLHQDVVVYLGGSGVTTANGRFVVGIAGTTVPLHTQAAVYGRCGGSDTCVVSYMEHFDS